MFGNQACAANVRIVCEGCNEGRPQYRALNAADAELARKVERVAA